MGNPLLPPRALADRRPRVHIRSHPRGASFRFGATGMEITAESPEEAFKNAREALNDGPMIVIYGDEAHG